MLIEKWEDLDPLPFPAMGLLALLDLVDLVVGCCVGAAVVGLSEGGALLKMI